MFFRIAIVIPSYCNSSSIQNIITYVLQETEHSVFVFDEGNSQAGNGLHSRLEVISLEKKLSKNALIAHAMQFLAAEGFTHLLILDPERLNLAKECNKLIEVAKQDPRCLVIGKSTLSTESISRQSNLERKVSSFWSQYQAEMRIADPRSDFRLYPLVAMPKSEFLLKRLNFEIDVLIYLIWKGIQLREVNIEGSNPSKEKAMSFFHKLWDHVRISLLNIVLVSASLVRTRLSAREVGLSFGIGIFIGTTPLFGFHTILVGIVAFALRLNALPMLLGTQISWPPMLAVLILLSKWLGELVLGISNAFVAYIAGSFILAAILGIVCGFVAYGIARFRTRRVSNFEN